MLLPAVGNATLEGVLAVAATLGHPDVDLQALWVAHEATNPLADGLAEEPDAVGVDVTAQVVNDGVRVQVLSLVADLDASVHSAGMLTHQLRQAHVPGVLDVLRLLAVCKLEGDVELVVLEGVVTERAFFAVAMDDPGDVGLKGADASIAP